MSSRGSTLQTLEDANQGSESPTPEFELLTTLYHPFYSKQSDADWPRIHSSFRTVDCTRAPSPSHVDAGLQLLQSNPGSGGSGDK